MTTMLDTPDAALAAESSIPAPRLGGVAPETFRVVSHLSHPESDLTAVAAVADRHLLVYVTALVDGRREVVALEYHPAPVEGSDEVIRERMAQALERTLAAGELTALSASVIRMPMAPVLAYLQGVAGSEEFQLTEVPAERLAELGARDRMLVPYLDDALMYVAALRASESPAAFIAQVRGISLSYARNRIARSRALDLLTPAERSVAAGELTETARRLVAWRDQGK